MKIAGVVLAGGLSTRMGQDKAQLSLGEQSLLAAAVELLHQAGLNDVFVSGNYPAYSCIADIHPHLGPLSGIHASMTALGESYDALFFLPVDMPLLSATECIWLVQQFAQFPLGVGYQRAHFPLILPVNDAIKDHLTVALTAKQKRQRSIMHLLEACQVHLLSYSLQQAFRFQNSNTPEQWQHCLAIANNLQQHKDK